jgi:hypothetical protein
MPSPLPHSVSTSSPLSRFGSQQRVKAGAAPAKPFVHFDLPPPSPPTTGPLPRRPARRADTTATELVYAYAFARAYARDTAPPVAFASPEPDRAVAAMRTSCLFAQAILAWLARVSSMTRERVAHLSCSNSPVGAGAGAGSAMGYYGA